MAGGRTASESAGVEILAPVQARVRGDPDARGAGASSRRCTGLRRPPPRAAGPPRRGAGQARRRRDARLPARDRPRSASRDWKVAPLPADLLDRRVEITGPVDRKMVINALNSGAKMFMADFEDSHSPTWDDTHRRPDQPARRRPRHDRLHQSRGQAVRARTSRRPRCWSARAAGTWTRSTSSSTARPISGSLFDFGLYFFHNAQGAARTRGPGPTSTCPSWRATSKPGCGTTSSCGPRASSACRAARSRPRC